MEMMNELLEKYFRGETTLPEEKVLKHYFLIGPVAVEHEIYRTLFEVFDQESTETAIAPFRKEFFKQQSAKQVWIRTIFYYGIAAALLLVLWIQLPQKQVDYAIIHGQRIDDPEYVQKYAEKRLNYVNEILKEGLKPMKSIDIVKQNLQPLKKIKETQDKIEKANKNNN